VFVTTRAAALLLVTLVAAAAIGVGRLNYDEFALMRRGVILRIYEAPVLRRSLFPVFFDIGLVAASIYAAIVLKTDDWGLAAHRALALQLFGIFPFVTIAAFWALRLYREAWRNAGVADFVRSHAAVAVSCAAGTIVCLLALPDPPELTFFAIYALVLLGLVSGSRGSYRFFASFRRPGAALESRQERVVIYGAGLGGTIALREVLSRPEHGMRPIGFIDDDPDLTGREINGYPVLGTLTGLPAVIARRKIGAVVVASPKIDRARLEDLEGICSPAGVRVVRFRRDFVVLRSPRTAEETVWPA
jgi:FlaA1/EpsC-like NDP-sugar epimerase